MTERPGLLSRASDYFLVRRANQTVVALLILAGIVVVAVWWYRNGGAEGKLLDRSGEPSAGHRGPSGARQAQFVVDLNSAGIAELVELPGVGEVIAERIVERRKKVGPFKSVDELLEIRDIGAKKLESIRPHVRVD
ncbi:MAG: helix-hairpin-helix domain-containing protein [Planctomycetaceae bacterium]|nr:helix-hairpin-helix domain-containing protein [Planctomycetaceae bacterium]